MPLPCSRAVVFNAAGNDVLERVVKTQVKTPFMFCYGHFDTSAFTHYLF